MALKVIFQGPSGQKKVKIEYLATFRQFSQKGCDNLFKFCAYNFLGMILISCQEIDMIELFESSLSMS